jgi:tRNA wybutosine-synthesizing protein 3
MDFTLWKQNILNKEDKSIKGHIDKPVKELAAIINNNPDYCTTSSCSGRIVVRKEPLSGKKQDTEWLFISHSSVTGADVMNTLSTLPQERLWFRFEPLILHIGCRTLEAAEFLLRAVQPLYKHSGIIPSKSKVMVQIRGSSFIEAPIAQHGSLMIDDKYIMHLCDAANGKMRINNEKISALKEALKEALKTHLHH